MLTVIVDGILNRPAGYTWVFICAIFGVLAIVEYVHLEGKSWV